MKEENLPKALKTFTYQFDIRVFCDENKGDWQMPMEWHSSLELFFVQNGRGRYVIGEKVYNFEKGDIFVIGNNELHKSELVDAAGFSALVVMFAPDILFPGGFAVDEDPMDLFYLRNEDFGHRLRPARHKREAYLGVAGLMREEYERGGGAQRAALRGLLTWLLCDLRREYRLRTAPREFGTSERVKRKKIINEVLDYIDEHYEEDISIGKLADALFINHSYLSREFKKSTGYSLVKFITNKRIREARELLRTTSLTVADIATRVGYNNITHFHAMFKAETGTTPKAFRSSVQRGDEYRF